MRVIALLLVLFVGVVASPGEGFAEKVKANQETKLFARPGERAKVILTVSEGKAMTVLAKEGRWLKVRVAGRTGYVARSTVDMPEGDEIARNTRRRSFVDGRGTKRGFGGDAPDDRIGADAIGEGREDEPVSKKGNDDEDEDEDEPPKKAAAKEPPKKEPPKKEEPKKEPPKVAAKEPPKKEPPKKDDEDEDEDENPLPKGKTPPKAVATKTAKPPTKGSDDDDDEDEDDEDSRPRIKLKNKTTMFNEADPKSEKILVATNDTLLFATGEKKGKYTEVENDEGDLGYILTADIAGAAAVAEKKKDDPDDDDEEPVKRGGSMVDIRAKAGVTLLTQGLRTPGGVSMVPDNYNIATSAVTIALGAGYYRPFKRTLVIGVDLGYEYANAFGGIPTPPKAGETAKTTTKVSLHRLNIRAVLGKDFNRPSGLMLLGRLGFNFHSFQVANAESMTDNTAKLPSEVIQSPMIGVALAMPRLSNKLGLRFSLDFIPLNFSYSQTKNLEDGTSPSAKGAVIGSGLAYRWKAGLDIAATYDLTYMSMSFGDRMMTSMRGHPMGGVKRTDMYHAITVGVVKAF